MINKKVFIVTRQLLNRDKVIHKVYIFDEISLIKEGYDHPEQYMLSVINEEIEDFQNKFVEFKQASFVTLLMSDVDVVIKN